MEARRQKFVYLGNHPAKAGQGTALSSFLPPSTPDPDPFLGLPGTHSALGVKSLPHIQVLPDLLSHPGLSFCYLNWYDLLPYPRVQLWSLFLFLAVLGLCCFVWAFSSCSEQGLLFIVVCRLLIVVAFSCGAQGFRSTGFSSCGAQP